MADQTLPEIYLVHLWIRQISPMIGRRLLVRSDRGHASEREKLYA
jgi:hypothetical protein